MNRQTEYRKAPKALAEAIEHAEIIEDFLPSPDQLMLREDTVEVTLTLSKHSVEILQKRAEENGVPYEHMIKRILDAYTAHLQEPTSR